MKPVIKVQRHYHLLLMRDDKEVVGLKVHNTLLRILLGLFCLFLALGGGGIAFGLSMWNQNQNLKSIRTTNEAELAQARIQLEELSNVKSLLLASSGLSPLTINQEINIPAQDSSMLSETNATQRLNSTPTPQEALANATASSATHSNATSAVLGPGNGHIPGVNATEPAPKFSSLSDDASPMRINNFTSYVVSQTAIRIRYDLVSAAQDAIRGTAKYTAIMSDGTVYDMTPQYNDDARFAISRMKRMDTTARLPQETNARGISSIRMTIVLDNGEAYQGSYDMTSR